MCREYNMASVKDWMVDIVKGPPLFLDLFISEAISALLTFFILVLREDYEDYANNQSEYARDAFLGSILGTITFIFFFFGVRGFRCWYFHRAWNFPNDLEDGEISKGSASLKLTTLEEIHVVQVNNDKIENQV
ncbi:Uncharacterized protein Adt_42851 [Abeliophyllum distichum]|uniref:Uncharacterized protein n=1 Tax=Abeliophyllum distichum TaxID=126358 RepID=A0ABD1PSU8_9LAMI